MWESDVSLSNYNKDNKNEMYIQGEVGSKLAIK